MLTSAKLRGPRHYKVYFLELHMDVYLSAKFEGGGGGCVILPPPSPLGENWDQSTLAGIGLNS